MNLLTRVICGLGTRWTLKIECDTGQLCFRNDLLFGPESQKEHMAVDRALRGGKSARRRLFSRQFLLAQLPWYS